jgi:cob(I)alamin adenosyltransferase
VTRIYTRTGDRGETGLFGGGRVHKSHPRVEAYGDVDELNAAIGVALAALAEPEVREKLASVQPDLFAIGAHLATPRAPGGEPHPHLPALPQGRATEFEGWIDQADSELPALHAFILPGGAPGAAALHLARTICRRAERRIIALDALESVEPEIVVYLNRLSDLLFQFARLANHRAGVADLLWAPRGQ